MSTRYAFCIAATLVLLLITAAAAADTPNKETTVKASVYAAARNDKGEVTDVLLITEIGDELFVVHNAVGDKLLTLVEQNIRVTGSVTQDGPKRKWITVSKYEIAYN